MTERTFRLILGIALISLLYINVEIFYFIYVGLLIFEGTTNYRIPILVSMLRYGKNTKQNQINNDKNFRFEFEAERAMRLVFAAVLLISLFTLPQELWFLNWIIATFLTLAGIVNMCPVVLSLRWIGFR